MELYLETNSLHKQGHFRYNATLLGTQPAAETLSHFHFRFGDGSYIQYNRIEGSGVSRNECGY